MANAIKWANENKVPIRPRAGRHSLEVNLSQVNGGIVIDVSKMRKIRSIKNRAA
ncbi:FAD-binding protein [Paenibacillus sp. P22]|uniref:FAD-binding protein n=1 Tax=Paenibacillus sp. P22 TaxID=483908 RepID=UPI0022B74982|nr:MULTISPECIES: FAD-binding protein [unclassified Paenibacillus]